MGRPSSALAGQDDIAPLVYDGIPLVFSAGHVEALDGRRFACREHDLRMNR
jgi:hypothetical protein